MNKKRIKVIFPAPVDAKTIDTIASQVTPGFLPDNYEVVFEAVKAGAVLADSYHDHLLMEFAVVESGLTAKEEGFDAICIHTVSDSGLLALRSSLNIPVISSGASSFYMACNLGKKFSVITMWEKWFPLYEKTINEYRLWDRLASMRSIDTRPDIAELLEGKEDVVFQKLLEQSNSAINNDGADVIILGSTTMSQSYTFLQENLSVPVINPGLAALKTCQAVLELGLSHSKKAYPFPEVARPNLYHRVVKE